MRPRKHTKAAEKADAKFKEAEKKCEAQSTLVTFLATSNRQWGSSFKKWLSKRTWRHG